MKHKDFEAQAQSGWSDFTVPVISTRNKIEDCMTICTETGPVYITKQQCKDFYGLCELNIPEPEMTELKCSICNEPQFETPSGLCCKNGHGGADSI